MAQKENLRDVWNNSEFKNGLFNCKFMKSEYRSSISGENLASKFRCAVSINYTSDFEDLVWKKCEKLIL